MNIFGTWDERIVPMRFDDNVTENDGNWERRQMAFKSEVLVFPSSSNF